MIIILKGLFRSQTSFIYQRQFSKLLLGNILVSLLLFVLNPTYSVAQSGNWDANGTDGTTGYTDHGNGVIQLLDRTSSGCASAAIHETTDTYDPTSGAVFNKCYEVFFGCPGDDQIGSDTKGDGLAFSFWKGAYNINNGLACGGGLGYMGANGAMITIEFDTWSSQGTAGFDNTYEGTGDEDQIAIHRDGSAFNSNKIVGANPGNLEDGLEHTVCINYDPATDIMTISIDGSNVLVHDFTGSPYELATYFGAGGLNQTWSSGKFGATNPATVSDDTQQDITDQIGAPLCAEGVVITSPSTGSVFGSCETPVTIETYVTPPAANTVDSVEFYIDGVKMGVDLTEPFSYDWNNPDLGSKAIYSTAYYSPSVTNASSPVVNVTIGGKVDVAGTAPTIDGTVEAFWSSYTAIPLAQGFNSAPDLAGSYRVAYDATNLYLLIEVTDDDLRNDSGNDWDDDGAEVYIDINNDKSGGYGANDYQYSFAYNNAPTVVEYKHGTTAGVIYGGASVAGGYVIEVSFPWATLGSGAPSAGDFVGFDVKLNDDDGGGGRDHELGWYDGSFGAWNNTSLFGTQEFTNCDPLPVEFLSFNGHKFSNSVLLEWVTTIEVNNDRFVIERSANLTNWVSIGEVFGAGNSNAPINYSFVDYTPLDGVVYYRLRQVDFDGTSANSSVVVLRSGTEVIHIGPNPFDESLTIRSAHEGYLKVVIYDVLGRLLYEKAWDTFSQYAAIQPNLPPGAYFISIQSEQEVLIEERLIKM